MNTEFRDSPVTLEQAVSAVLKGCLLPVRITAYAIRLTAFAVLSTLEPVVQIVLSILALTGFATCVLYRFVLHAPHFPLGRMLLVSVALAVLSVLYGLLVRGTAP
jgi:hypothetical protein